MGKRKKSALQAEKFDPTNLDAIAHGGDALDEFIVKVDFDYCGVTYSGYQILTRLEIRRLLDGLSSKRRIGTPNMPGSWYERFDVRLLKDAFSIHSADSADVSDMRRIFGEWVGNTELFDSVMECASKDDSCPPNILNPNQSGDRIDLEIAQEFIDEEGLFELLEYDRIDDDAAELLSHYEDALLLSGLTELSDTAAESLSRHQGDLYLSGLNGLSDTAAESLSKYHGDLWLESAELSDNSAKALCSHQGNLVLDPDWIRSMDTSVGRILARKKGTINGENPRKWIAALKS